MTTDGTGTTSTKPPTLSLEFAMTALALIAQGLMTVELFEPASIAGKLVGVLGIVLTGLGYTVARAKAAKAVLPTSIYIAMLVLFVVSIAGSCTTGQRAAAGRVTGDSIDCLTPAAKEATGQLLPVFADAIRNATSPDGAVDKDRIKSVGLSLIAPTLRCAFVSAVAEAKRPRSSDPNALQSAELVPDRAQLSAAFEDLRAECGGPTFVLESGPQ
jgi:hypothetical protein